MENKNERKKNISQNAISTVRPNEDSDQAKKIEKRDNELAIAAAAVYDGRIYKMFG